MKLYKNIIFLAFVLGSFTACELADPIESQVTEYAEFEMTGERYLYVDQGTSFEDPGVTAVAGDEPIDVEISGAVDTSTPGVYELTYSAFNADGFPATTNRYVAVGDFEVAANRDLSGDYATSRGGTNTVSQITTGFYQNTDILVPNGISLFMVDLGNGNLVIPPQSSPFGEVYVDPSINAGTSGTLDSDTGFSLSMFIGCCGIFNSSFTQ